MNLMAFPKIKSKKPIEILKIMIYLMLIIKKMRINPYTNLKIDE